jgi:putative heme-binding domain-containing protein
MHEWGEGLARTILTAPPEPPQWMAHPLAGASPSIDPWVIERFKAGARGNVPFFTSKPRGETLTGVLRSREFVVPAQLTFWLAGHNGVPPATPPIKNIVRLRAEGTDEILAEAAPPRNDIAHKVTWDLKPYAGRNAYIEATDGDTNTGWAWIAFGGFEPAVVSVPARDLNTLSKRAEAAARIAASLKLDLAEPLRKLATSAEADAGSRSAAVKALGQIDPTGAAPMLAGLLNDASAPPAVRSAAATALAPLNSDAARAALVGGLASAPQNLQSAIALALADSKGGAGALLDAVTAGKASPRLLQDKGVLARLHNAMPENLDQRIATLTKGMANADEAVQKLIDQRRAGFSPAKASITRGREVFARNCTACHQIENVGARVGPQLDGIGKRGPDRLLEDILDPSRNVDAAFRYSILTLTDGDVQTGLQRREEGEVAVFADATGKEFSIPKARIAKRVESPLSLMPANFGDTIKPEELNDLLAFLLSK